MESFLKQILLFYFFVEKVEINNGNYFRLLLLFSHN